MIQKINTEETAVQKIIFDNNNSNLTQDVIDTEDALQQAAGVPLSSDYSGTRKNIAQRLNIRDEQELLNITEQNIADGNITPEEGTEFIKRYPRNINTDSTALEKAAAENLTNEAMSDNEEVAISQAIEGTVEDEIAKNLVVDTVVQEIQSSIAEGTNVAVLAGDAVETFAEVQVLENTVDRSIFEGKGTFEKSTEGLGEAYRKTLNEAMTKGTVEDVRKVMQRIKASVLSGFNKIDQMSRLNYFMYGGDEYQDVGGYVEAGGLLAGAAGKLFKMYKAAGNISKIKNMVKTADKASQISTGASKSVTMPVQKGTEIATAGRISDVTTEIAAERSSIKAMEEASLKGIYSEDELAKIAEVEKEKQLKALRDTSLDVIDANTIEDKDGALHTIITIGRQDGKAFTTIPEARKAAVRYGLTDANTGLTRQDGGGFFIQTDHMTTDSLKSNPDEWLLFAEKGTNKTARTLSGIVSYLKRKVVGGSISSSERTFDMAATAEGRYAGNMERLVKYEKTYSNLNKDERKLFDEIRYSSMANEKEYTAEELATDFNAPKNVIEAWKDFERLNIEYVNTLNDSIISRKHRAGVRQYNNVVGTKQSIKANKDNPNIIVKDGADLSKVSDDTHYLIKVDETVGDVEYTHVLMPKISTVEGPITKRLVGFRAGGLREYEVGNYYIKIGSSMINPKTGNKIKGLVKTITTAMDPKLAAKALDEINAVLKIARENDINDAVSIQRALDKLDNKLFKVDNYEDFKGIVKSESNPRGILDPEFEPQVLSEGQRYAYKDGEFSEIADGDIAIQNLIQSRQRFYNERGNLLDSINGGHAQLISIEETFDKLVEKASRMDAYNELYARFDEELGRYKDLIVNWYEIQNRNIRDKLVLADTGTVARARRQGKDLLRVRALETLLDRGQILLNARTVADKKVETVMMHFARAVEASPFRKIFNMNDYSIRKLADSDPRSFAKSMAYMGAFAGNITQGLTQLLGAALTVSMGNPLKLTPIRCVTGWLPYRLSLLMEGTKAEKYLDKTAQIAFGMSDEAYNKFKWLMNEGGGKQAAGYTTGFSKGFTKTYLEKKNTISSKFQRLLLMPMVEGNGANYVVATAMAVIDNPKVNNLTKLKGIASDLSLNMTRVGANKLQAGKTFIPFTDVAAQWSSFPTRLAEALSGQSKHLNARQVAQLHIGAITTMGIAGTYLGQNQGYNFSRWLSDKLGLSASQADDISYGYLNAWAKEKGMVLNNQANIADLIPAVWKLFDSGESIDLLEMFPAVRGVTQVFNTFKALKAIVYPDDGVLDFHKSMDYIAKTKYMPSGLRNLARWYIADIDGRYYSGHGEIIERGLDETQASLIGIAGMQPVEARKDLIKRGINNDIQSMYKYCDEGIDELLKAQAYYDMGGEYNDEYKQSTRAFTRAVAEYSKIIRERFGEEAANKWENKVFKRRFEKITDKNRNLPYNVLKYIEEMYKND